MKGINNGSSEQNYSTSIIPSFIVDELKNNEAEILIATLNNKETDEKSSALTLEARKSRTLNMLQEVISSASSMEEMDAIDEIVAKIKPTISAMHSKIGIFTSISRNIPANKNVEPQRRLFSTKKSSSKLSKSFQSMDTEEKKKIALSLIITEDNQGQI
mgnify:CR=1 FL=1